MKKFIRSLLRIISVVLLIMSIILIIILVGSILFTIIRILFFGMTVGNSKYPDSLWWTRTELYGIEGLIKYYSVIGKYLLIFEIPIIIVCSIYITIYFKIIKKRFNKKEETK